MQIILLLILFNIQSNDAKAMHLSDYDMERKLNNLS